MGDRKRPTIAITGSAGKTTTKEMIASILQKKWTIFKSKGNMNGSYNTYKYAQEILPKHQAVVLEFGMAAIGSGRRHCRSIQPNIGVITNVGTAHMGKFKDKVYGVARAKSELIQYMDQKGILYLNGDDDNSKLLKTEKFKGEILKIGIKNKANYQARDVEFLRTGMRFNVILDGAKHSFTIPIFGYHNVYNALFAIGVAHRLGFTPNEIKLGLRTYQKAYSRMALYSLKQGITMIDDSFSSNPDAVKAAIEVLTHFKMGLKIAVLGSMHELGSSTLSAHKEIGEYVAKRNIDYLFTYGEEAKWIREGAVTNGLAPSQAIHFTSKHALQQQLLKKIKPNTTILIKGAHGLYLYSVAKYLRNHFSNRR